MADPYYSELLGGGSTVMGESQGVFSSSGMMTPGIGGGINGSTGGVCVPGDCLFGSSPRLLTREDSAVCLRMTVRGN